MPLRNLPTQGAVALHASIGGAAKHGANNTSAHQDHSYVTTVRLLHVLLKQVGGIVANQVTQICQVVFVTRQEHSLA